MAYSKFYTLKTLGAHPFIGVPFSISVDAAIDAAAGKGHPDKRPRFTGSGFVLPIVIIIILHTVHFP